MSDYGRVWEECRCDRVAAVNRARAAARKLLNTPDAMRDDLSDAAREIDLQARTIASIDYKLANTTARDG